MQALIDRLSADLAEQYASYLQEFSVKLWSEAGQIEFRCEFALRGDQVRGEFTIKVPADAGETDGQRELLIIVVFEEIEHIIDEAIAEQPMAVN